uniref:Uncharacterized protein n=1 Tax=Zea mays TaxID=4577 RepID=A0A804UEG7_MAIZE
MPFSPRPVSRSSSSLLHGSKHGRRAPPMAPAKLEQPLSSHCSALLVSPQPAPFFPTAASRETGQPWRLPLIPRNRAGALHDVDRRPCCLPHGAWRREQLSLAQQ